MPSTSPRAVDAVASTRMVKPPCRKRLQTSWPIWSVPKRAPGPFVLLGVPTKSWPPCGAMCGPMTAMARMKSTNPRPIWVRRRRSALRKSAPVGRRAVRTSGVMSWLTTAMLLEPRPQTRGDQDGRDVRHQVEEHVEAGNDHGDRLHHRQVTVGYGIAKCAANPSVVEDDLANDDTAREIRQVDADDLEGRPQRVRERVAAEHDSLRQPLEPRHLDVVTLEHLDHRRPHDADDVGGHCQDQRQRREDEGDPLIPRSAPGRSP